MSCQRERTWAYGSDLRWRIIWQRKVLGLSFRQVSRNLNICYTTARNIEQLFDETGQVQPRGHPPQDTTLDAVDEVLLLAIVIDNPEIHLEEMRAILYEQTGLTVSSPTLCRILRRYNFSRKKIRLIARQRVEEDGIRFMARMACFPREMFVFVDETGCDRRDYLRKTGYALRGDRAERRILLARGNRVNAMAALSVDGIVEARTSVGRSLDGDAFYDFVRVDLLPHLRPFDGTSPCSILVMDNWSGHGIDDVINLIEDVGVLLFFLPPYSPNLNPIEEAFSFVKSELRNKEQGSEEDLLSAFDQISPEHACAWIKHAGY